MARRDKLKFQHAPVLADAVLRALRPASGQTVVDATLGLGGHSRLLLEAIAPAGRLIGTDFDPVNLEHARSLLAAVPGGHFMLHHGNFAGLPAVLAAAGVDKVDGILADLGVASPQIDDPARGFSYKHDGPLDMRMDPTRSTSAAHLIARISQRDLADAILDYGDETDAEAIAALIVERRKQQPITTTMQLSNLICEARDFTPQRALGAKLHPAARTFQALRMLVNREAENLDRLLTVAPGLLKRGGRIAIISFHSGEDRRVKQSFREQQRAGNFSRVSDDAVTATEAEVTQNPRSRSAKLRWAERA